MRFLVNNRLAKLLFALCVLATVMVFMPHHHQGGDMSVCLDLIETVDGEREGTCGDDDGGSGALCMGHSMEAVRPGVHMPDAVAICCHAPGCVCADCVPMLAVRISESTAAVAIKVCRYGSCLVAEYGMEEYMADALPCRAPDFVA